MSEPMNITDAPGELELLRLTNQVHQRLGSLLERERVLEQFVLLVAGAITCQRVIVLMADRDGIILEYGACYPALADVNRQMALEMLYINIFNTAGDALLQQIKQHQPVVVATETMAGSRLEELSVLLDQGTLQFFPLILNGEMPGVLVLHHAPEAAPLPPQHPTLHALIESAVVHIANARQHSQIVQELATTVYEMNILQQIDAELNDTIDLNYVFRMIMDWGLRFTSATAAALGLYDQENDTLRVMTVYGYQENVFTIGRDLDKDQGGITLRVARSGDAEVIPDVAMDKDYYSAYPSSAKNG
ncbi:MAG: GAF domain-containing protein [Anaerolineae bacterium]|nr:GAF domain-containing protein [Anaerolineae bacterium]